MAHFLLPPFINFCLSFSTHTFLSFILHPYISVFVLFIYSPFLPHFFHVSPSLFSDLFFHPHVYLSVYPSLPCVVYYHFHNFISYTRFSLCSVFARSSPPITVTCHIIRNIPNLHPCPGFRLLRQYHAALHVRYCELLSHAHTRTHAHTHTLGPPHIE